MTDPIEQRSNNPPPPKPIPETKATTPRKSFEPGFSTVRLIAGESADELNDLAIAMLDFFKPKNVIERILVTDIVHAEWELRRNRKFGGTAIQAARPWSVSRLNGFKDERFCDSPLPKGSYEAGIADLEAKGYSIENIDAFSALSYVSALESFDKRSASAELRRNAALAALEERQAQSARADRTINATANERPVVTVQDNE